MPLVFAYGSLVAGGVPATLRGFRRTWGVAMDNGRAIPGYKVYVDPRTGERPSVHVAFVDLAEHAGGAVNGVLLAVDDAALRVLDRRERNYSRVTVPVAGADEPVWTYLGTPAARRRRQVAAQAGRLVVQREYLELVRSGFAALGDGALAAFEASTDPVPGPVVDLVRVDL